MATIRLIGRRQRRLKLRQHRLHVVDRLDDVGAGLAEQDDENGRLAVRHAEIAHILDAVGDLGDVGQAHRRAVAIGDDQGRILGRRAAPVSLT